MIRKSFIRALLLATPLAFAAETMAAESVSNKWRIEISEGANSTGTMQFRITSAQGQPIDVAVTVREGRGENGVARDIRDAFQAQLPADRFSVETDDGEDVLVKKVAGQPDFSIELLESTVTGTRVAFDKE